MLWLKPPSFHRLIDWFNALIDWLSEWVSEWVIDWLIDLTNVIFKFCSGVHCASWRSISTAMRTSCFAHKSSRTTRSIRPWWRVRRTRSAANSTRSKKRPGPRIGPTGISKWSSRRLPPLCGRNTTKVGVHDSFSISRTLSLFELFRNIFHLYSICSSGWNCEEISRNADKYQKGILGWYF